jgi:hypothetical protein
VAQTLVCVKGQRKKHFLQLVRFGKPPG